MRGRTLRPMRRRRPRVWIGLGGLGLAVLLAVFYTSAVLELPSKRNWSKPHPLAITMGVMPPGMRVGWALDYEIAIMGGRGGPYRVELVEGELPTGVRPDDAESEDEGGWHRHHLAGVFERSGTFRFRLRVTDLQCEPPDEAEADFEVTILPPE